MKNKRKDTNLRRLSIFLVAVLVCMAVLSACEQSQTIPGNNEEDSKIYPGTNNLMTTVSTTIEQSDEEIAAGLENGGAERYCNFAVELFKESFFGGTTANGSDDTADGSDDTADGSDDTADGSGEVASDIGRVGTGDNLLVSPLSVIYAMAMVSNGAEGMTKSELLTALTEGRCTGEAMCGTSSTGVGDIFDEMQDNLNNYLRAYMNMTEKYAEETKEQIESMYGNDSGKPNATTLNIANSIWLKQDEKLTVNDEFLETNGKYYNAGIRETVFNDAARKSINKWIENHTGGLIKDMLDTIPDKAIMYLINALAFEADWATPYTEYQVRDGDFYGDKGTTSVEFMTDEERYFLEDARNGGLATGFIKPYVGWNYAFAALLPNEGVPLDGYVESLTGEVVHSILSNPIPTKVVATMPKFESESSLNLVDTFKALGVKDAFDVVNADFTKLGTYEGENILIGRILHDTFIKVDEKGTKAGAATIVEMLSESAAIMEPEPKYVVLDRPFVYMLIDLNENIPVFIGTVRDL